MNKKLNTLFFVIGATLFNIVVTLLLMFLLVVVVFGLGLSRVLPQSIHQMTVFVFFIGSIVLAFIVYKFALNRLLSKIRFEDYFDPIFRGRRPPPKRKTD